MKLKIIFVLLTLITAIHLFAQSAQRDEERFFYGSNVDKDFEVANTAKSFSNKGIQYGAILSPIYILDDSDEVYDSWGSLTGGGRLSSYILNAKVWGKVYLWDNSFFYIRGKNSYLGIISKKGIYDNDYYKSDNLLDLDLSYLSMSFKNLNISAGRNYYTVGTGLVLNGRGDGGEIAWNSSFLSINLLGLYTGLLIKDDNPYKLSDIDVADGAKRGFAGGTVSAFFYNQKLYLFGLVQRDFADEDDPSSKKRYNSEYYGAGLDGVLFSNMSYYAEFVYETGKSYAYGDTKKYNISAYAINSGIYYYIPVVFSPALIFQYSFGSGDKYRSQYSGSLRDYGSGDDKGFIPFGTFNGGYALKPNLGNMHIIRGGFSFAPFKAMSLGAKYLYYLKDKKEAHVNAGEARVPEKFVGQGIDVSFRWQIFYDLSMYVNYGLFLPGDAYDEDGFYYWLPESKKARNFVMAGVNFSI
ncbi:MAG: alginate export family protein [Spirochaetes bacterium]|nr:alginate export family protein [Spirochaetota bacterium]